MLTISKKNYSARTGNVPTEGRQIICPSELKLQEPRLNDFKVKNCWHCPYC